MKTEREKRLETLLYNAISLLIDETLEQYDDITEWADKMTKELDCTVAELKEYGGLINCDEVVDEVEEFWKFKG